MNHLNFQHLPPQPPPDANSKKLPLPLSNPIWVYILLGTIIFIFILEETFPYYAQWVIPYLPVTFEDLLLTDFRGGSTNQNVLILFGANFTPLVLKGQVWRFFSSMFLHIGFFHLLFNGYGLFIFGKEMEQLFGKTRFIIIYILSGLFGSLASFAFNDVILSAGASGAIFGIVGMQVTYFYKYKDLFGSFGKDRLTNLAIIVVFNLGLGFTQVGIDNLAHLGGLISGLLLTYPLTPNYKVINTYTNSLQVIDQNNMWLQFWVVVFAIIILVIGTLVALGQFNLN